MRLQYRNRYGLLAEDVHPADRRIVGQFSADLLDGRADIDGDAAVAQLGGSVLARLVVVSNRVAVPTGDGAKRAGGLEVALRPALQRHGGIWFGWSGKVAARRRVDIRLSAQERRPMSSPISPRTTIRNTTTASPIACCGRSCISGSTSPSSRAAISADISGSTNISPPQLEKIINPTTSIWVHDYHLIPIADALRRRGHANRIGFFLHVPFPPPEVLTSLPNHEQLIPLLLQYDVVGFQTEGDAGNFVRYLMTEAMRCATCGCSRRPDTRSTLP